MSSTIRPQTSLPVGMPRFLTVEEVALLLRCKVRTIYNMVSQNAHPLTARPGDNCFLISKEIEEWTKASAERR